MKKYVFILLLAFIFYLTSSYSKVSASEVVINFKENTSDKEINNILKELESNRENFKYLSEIKTLFINDFDDKKIRKSYKKVIKSSGQGIKLKSNNLSSEDFKDYNWFINKILKKGIGNKNYSAIKVGVIDSGTDSKNINLNYDKSRNYISKNKDLTDDTGHGTMVSNIINTISPNTFISLYKVTDKGGGDSSHTIEAIIEASKYNDIVNISLGTYKNINSSKDKHIFDMFNRAIEFAKGRQTVIVASAGNEGKNLLNDNYMHLPGGHKDVVTVGSTLKNNKVANYSNFGKNLDIVAPGGYLGEDFDKNMNIDVTQMLITVFPIYLEQNEIDKALGLQKGYSLNYGTSLSAPQVTAALVRLKYENPNANTLNLVEKLYTNAIDIEAPGKDFKSGYGLLQIK